MLFHAVAQRVARDAEDLGRRRDVAAALAQRVDDQRALGIREARAVGGLRERPAASVRRARAAGRRLRSAASIASRAHIRQACSMTLRSSRMLPGQGWLQQRRARLVGEMEMQPAILLAQFLHHALGDGDDVAAALAERRKIDDDGVEAVEQVAAELAARRTLLDRGIGGGDDLDVDRPVARAADGADHAVLERLQELCLLEQRQLADFVEEQRAAVGRLEQADLLLARAGEGAALMAEELGLDQLLGQGCAVDGDEGLGGARDPHSEGRARRVPCRFRFRRG